MSGRRAYSPTWVTEIELSQPRSDLVAPAMADGVGPRYLTARVLVRLHGAPLGQLDVPLDGGRIAASRLDAAIVRDLGDQLSAHLREDGLDAIRPAGEPLPPTPSSGCGLWGPMGPRPPVSVVVCTRDRPAVLIRCLDALDRLEYPDFEVVVVDNASSSDATAAVIDGLDRPRVRYVMEPRAGLSRARNRGVATARGEIIAFTDDDVVVDPLWLEALVRGFARRSDVGCVTGLVPALELETAAQRFFDAKVSWGSFFRPQIYHLSDARPDDHLFPFTVGRIGAGANFAFTRRVFEAVGRFDVALGPGSPSRSGDDLDFFVRVLLSGAAISYEPAAIAWHAHRRRDEALRGQLFDYGSGVTAYATKQIMTPATRWAVVRRLPRALRRLAYLLDRGPDEPRGRAWSPERRAELAGMMAGPFLYLRGRRGGA
jgi:GT2 family glycosyltransferase